MSASLRSAKLIGLVCLGLWLVGCEREHVARYTTRGLVLQREGQGEAERVAIQHEAIARFEDRDRKTAPMRSMTMVFGLAEGLDTEALRPSHKVRFSFEVRWTESPFLTVTRIEPLPDNTPLVLPAAHDRR